MLQALVTIECRKPTSSSAASGSRRANVGDLLAEALENLRISLIESENPEDEYKKTLLACEGPYARDFTLPSPFYNSTTEARRDRAHRDSPIYSLIAHSSGPDAHFPNVDTSSHAGGGAPPTLASGSKTVPTSSTTSGNTPSGVPSFDFSSSISATDDFAMGYDDILTSVELSEMLSRTSPENLANPFEPLNMHPESV